ncbi:11551_t:CDS:2 [Funneliformis mosseae]|uniref:11551_t:CDS:1 n=1 Tax=Funneliformis mosseae TaxID=27381 RepID=A0A9N8YR44_FUNMO|nr:11551_t:CDS:2 [Funneliformis mosseae]
MAGKAQTLLEATFNMFNTSSENTFTNTLNDWRKNFRIRQNSAVSILCTYWAIKTKALKLAFLITMMEKSSFITNTNHNEHESNEDTVCHDENFIDISLCNQWDTNKIKSIGLTKLDNNNPFFQDLYRLYSNHLGLKAMLLNRNLKYYRSIAYTVLKSNQDSLI